jgi:hypothetical protein
MSICQAPRRSAGLRTDAGPTSRRQRHTTSPQSRSTGTQSRLTSGKRSLTARHARLTARHACMSRGERSLTARHARLTARRACSASGQPFSMSRHESRRTRQRPANGSPRRIARDRAGVVHRSRGSWAPCATTADVISLVLAAACEKDAPRAAPGRGLQQALRLTVGSPMIFVPLLEPSGIGRDLLGRWRRRPILEIVRIEIGPRRNGYTRARAAELFGELFLRHLRVSAPVVLGAPAAEEVDESEDQEEQTTHASRILPAVQR